MWNLLTQSYTLRDQGSCHLPLREVPVLKTEPWWTCNVCGDPIAKVRAKNSSQNWVEHQKICPKGGGRIVQWDQRKLSEWKRLR